MDIQRVQPDHWKIGYILEGYEVGYEYGEWTVMAIEGANLYIKANRLLQTPQDKEETKVNKDKIEWIKSRKFEKIPYTLRIKCLENMKKRFAEGTYITLLKMNDPFNKNMHQGLLGASTFIDDAGTTHARWENGSALGVVYGEDAVAIINKDFNFKRGDVIQFEGDDNHYAVIFNLGDYGLLKDLSTDAEIYTTWIQKQGRKKIRSKKVDKLPDHMIFDL